MKRWKKPTKNFYMMPNEVFNLDLDPYEFMILSYLVRRMNSDSECWPSFKTMSKDLGISISTLEDRVAKMCKRKLISVQKNTGSGNHRNNVYTLWSLETRRFIRTPTRLKMTVCLFPSHSFPPVKAVLPLCGLFYKSWSKYPTPTGKAFVKENFPDFGLGLASHPASRLKQNRAVAQTHFRGKLHQYYAQKGKTSFLRTRCRNKGGGQFPRPNPTVRQCRAVFS